MESLNTTRIVVAVDASEMAPVVIEHGLDAAARHRPAELHFLRVVHTGPLHRTHPEHIDAAHDGLAREVRMGIDAFGRTAARVRIHACAGDPVEEIVALAEDVGAELVIVGRHGGLGQPSRLGSVPRKLLSACHASLLVVQPEGYQVEISQPVCPRCAEVRAASGGDMWFCAEHADLRPWRSTAVITEAFIPTDGTSTI